MEFSSMSQANRAVKNDHNVECGDFDEYDDVFYAELRRQILLLTEEDEGEFEAGKRGTKGLRIGRGVAAQPGSYFSWREDQADGNLVPTWLVNLWRTGNGNGTGVFIPHVKYSRRRHRPGRRNNENKRMYKQVENKKS
ncbi:hypothetical protein HS088_TW07G01192 [Tripterygium wilfordii]|uniref:Uncharacterized protein n=1 Tax=Tripterygium wilfordii TaxID=458696 RepID=A0A7J7DGU7_TRIWF|nr:hypothetical protein HS088_TW07G01192 [Tripterygium wilfordii]